MAAKLYLREAQFAKLGFSVRHAQLDMQEFRSIRLPWSGKIRMKGIRFLTAGRALALAAFVAVAAALLAYLFLKQHRVAVESTRPKLQGSVVAVFNNTHYAHEVRGQVRFILNSEVDRSYQDGTHELEGVTLESFGKDNDRHDFVTADRAKVSNPSDMESLDAELMSNVVVKTSDGLTVKSEYLRYQQKDNTIETDKPFSFEGRNFSGTATGLFLEVDPERAHLLHDVDVTIKDKPPGDAKSDDSKSSDAKPASNASRQVKKRPQMSAEERAAHKEQKRLRKQARKASRKGAGGEDSSPSVAKKPTGRDSRGEASISAVPASKKPTRIQCASAVLEKKDHRVTLEQNVIVTQVDNEARADLMIAYMDASNHIERVEARGNSHLKQTDKAELSSPDMDFIFGPSHQLVRGVAWGGANSRSLGADAPREAYAERLEATFVETDHGSLADTLIATGNAIVKVHAPPEGTTNKPPTERELRADNISLQFQPDGRNLKSADAVGSAVMTVVPYRAEPKADKKTLRAPRQNAVFFDAGNKIKTFTATGGVRVEVEALLAGQHEPRVTTSKRLTADFVEDTQDIDHVVQEGDFKYSEGDRNGLADRAAYDGQKEILQLRGRRPMAWDSKARTQADEIDYDRANDETHARGDVRTTYYSRDTTGDSTPFENNKSPVFITADRADASNKEGVAVYTDHARGWQDDNFVKGDRIELYHREKRMVAEGHVETALYRVKRGETSRPQRGEASKPQQKPAEKKPTSANGNDDAPGFAWSDRMTYSDTDRLVHYDGSVRARHGTDYIEADAVDVYLMQETNEVDHLIADQKVVLIQPGRRGTGDHLTYTSDDGRAVLTGKIAKVEDAEKGSTMGSQLTFYSRDDKIQVESQQGTGRVRTTHRMAKH